MQQYNYQLNFWDDQGKGVEILLEHVGKGFESCKCIVEYFEERSKLEKDYARRLGAISHLLQKQQTLHPDYGYMMKNMEDLRAQSSQLAQMHSKQAEQIYVQSYAQLKEFLSDSEVRLKTLDGRIRSLLEDKLQKHQIRENAMKKLEEAQVKQHKTILGNEASNNQHQLENWQSVVEELGHNCEVLSREYRKAEDRWLHEWVSLSIELQLLEESRIETMKTRLQEFTNFAIDTAVQEQTIMDKLNIALGTFTAQQDIQSFAYTHGTGRMNLKSIGANISQRKSGSEFVDKHIKNMRKLSSKLSNRKGSASKQQNLQIPGPHMFDFDDGASSVYSENDNKTTFPASGIRPSYGAPARVGIPMLSKLNLEERIKTHPALKTRSLKTCPNGSSGHNIHHTCQGHIDDYTQRNVPLHDADSIPKRKGSSDLSCNSNTSDFTDKKISDGTDSMCTSISSFASSIDDEQRLTKCWNSNNRRKMRNAHNRKSFEYKDSSKGSTYHTGNESGIEHVYGATSRRKSLAKDLEGALKELERAELANHRKVGYGDEEKSSIRRSNERSVPFKKNEKTIDYPQFTSKGYNIIGHAKALYSYTEPNDNNILNFKMGDLLLLIEKLNVNWYIGEVHKGNGMHGLIPVNYIDILL